MADWIREVRMIVEFVRGDYNEDQTKEEEKERSES
jgi:hypothetical protein